ncbi:MAG: glycyl-radical enzyme activating protein [Pseudomonadales bacterium]|nr:glycyl-radical enzyme activating protein [Pseudomonadales bacterium]
MLTPPQIFSVQHFCVHDGPGIRSVVFFKGCPLRCSWCQNPESWSKEPELGYKEHSCLQCTTCVNTCPTGAMYAPGHWTTDSCTQCFRCIDTCPGGALTRFGATRSPENILHELSQEFALYRQSQGGVTFSGGEATLYPEYLAELLPPLQAAGIPTALETCGLFHLKAAPSLSTLLSSVANWQEFSAQTLWQVLSRLDLILFDLKLMDNQLHRQHCGSSNRLILHNFSLLTGLARAGQGPKVWPRLPLVPGITDHPDNLHAVAQFLHHNDVKVITLLPYHNLGVDKYNWLRIPIKFDHSMLGDDALQQATQIMQACGIRCYTSGEEDYAQLYGDASCSTANAY